MANPNESAPLLSNEKAGGDVAVDYQYPPPPSSEPPPPGTAGDAYPPQPPQYGYPQYQAGTGYYDQYPPTYPQYGSDQQQQKTVIVQQQPATGVMVQQTLYTREEYNTRITILFILSAIACLICWPFALVACILSCLAISNVNEGNNPRPTMTAALVFIVLSFVVGIPLSIVLIVLRT